MAKTLKGTTAPVAAPSGDGLTVVLAIAGIALVGYGLYRMYSKSAGVDPGGKIIVSYSVQHIGPGTINDQHLQVRSVFGKWTVLGTMRDEFAITSAPLILADDTELTSYEEIMEVAIPAAAVPGGYDAAFGILTPDGSAIFQGMLVVSKDAIQVRES